MASFVDAQTGEVLVREGLVDRLADNPTWTVFSNTPPMDYASTDTRVRWCWLATANCALVLDNPASLPWDIDASDFVCSDANCTQRTQAQRRRGLRSGAGVRLAVRQRGDRSLHAHRQRLRRGGPALRGPLRGAREPIADTDPGTPLNDTFKLVPGTYEMVARANGFGHVRTTLTVRAGQLRDFRVNMPLNLASGANAATATGDGINLGGLIDDTEMTNWASLGSPVAGKQVTVRLDGRQTFDRIQVSAMLRQRIPTDPNDGGSQSRFSALRQFELLACDARGAVDCSQPSQFTSVFTSAADAFPSAIPRPRAPELIIRSFDVPRTRATHVRLRC